jgi:hypothetical protein
MPFFAKEIPPALLAEGRYLYEETPATIEEVAARLQISRTTFYNRQREWKWTRRRFSPAAAADAALAAAPPAMLLPPAEPRVLPAVDAVTLAARTALYTRIFGAALAQMDTIEDVLRTLGSAPGVQTDRTLRLFGAINRALRDIRDITQADGSTLPDEADHDAVPGDADSFRNELARRIHALIDDRERRRGDRAAEPRAGGNEPQGGADA